MKAIILAAGRGSRMESMTDERPKCLVELNGETLLEKQLKALRAAGITEIGIVTGYKQEMLKKYGLVEFHNPLWAESQMVCSLACASDWLENEPCIVSYSDIFYEPSAVKLLIGSDGDLAITYDPYWLNLWTKRFGDPLLDAETFKLNNDGTLEDIGNKPKTVEEVQGQYMGLLKFTPAGWNKIKDIRSNMEEHDLKTIHMTGIMQILIKKFDFSIITNKYLGAWGEVDSRDDLIYYSSLNNG
jgi:L-glutamine-phosphate cytidylyltransferase